MADQQKRQRRPSRRALESQESRSRSPLAEDRRGRGRGTKKVPTGIGRGRGHEDATDASQTSQGRGKGRGRGGRRKDDSGQYDLEELRKERESKIEEIVNTMGEEEVKKLLVLAIVRDPFLLTKTAAGQPGEDPPPPPPHGPSPNWCVCGHCRDMPSDVEKRCCRRTPENCTANSRDMQIAVLDPLVLYVYRMCRRDIFALHAVDEGDLNRQNRHAAYRSFVLWTWGRLTAGDRRVIPSCCVWRIRDTYPDPHQQYRGFIPGRLN